MNAAYACLPPIARRWAKFALFSAALALANGAVAALIATNLWPAAGGTNVCTDTPLRITFNAPPTLNNIGKIRIYNMTNTSTPVSTLDLTLNLTLPAVLSGSTSYATNVQPRTIAGTTYTNFPVIISGNTAFIYPTNTLTNNQTYYISVDPGIFSNSISGSFAGIADTTAWRFTTKATLPSNSATKLVVAADGSGDFCTVQGVVDFIPSGTTPRVINLRDGIYQEIIYINSKNNLTFRGQDRNQTIITYPNNDNLNNSSSTRVMIHAKANDIAFDNLTLSNSTPRGGSQAEALRVYGSRAIVNNCNLDSYQDTLLVDNTGNTVYLYNTRIQGDTDYTWGVGTAYFTNCVMVTMTSGGYNCQPRTPSGANGFAWVNCQILGNGGGITGQSLARSGGNSYLYGQAAYINCTMDTNVIASVGWNSNSITNTSNLRFWEYQSIDLTGHLVNTNLRAPWAVQISAATAATVQNVSSWLGWQPQLSPNITSQPTNQTVAAGQPAVFTVAATGIPDPSYQWRFNGTNIASATNAIFTIAGVQATNAAAYSVIVSNASGAVISSNATLTVNASVPPVLGSINWSGGQFGFTFSGGAGTDYAVQASSNLTQWETVFSTNSPPLPFNWADTNTGSYPARYYRVQVN